MYTVQTENEKKNIQFYKSVTRFSTPFSEITTIYIPPIRIRRFDKNCSGESVKVQILHVREIKDYDDAIKDYDDAIKDFDDTIKDYDDLIKDYDDAIKNSDLAIKN